MQDLVDLICQLLVDLGDDGVDRIDRVVCDQILVLQDLLSERLDRGFDLLTRPIALGPELFLEQRLKVADFDRCASRLLLGALDFGHA